VESIAREPLISTKPFPVTKCTGWLVSKEHPVSETASLVVLNSATVYHPTLQSSSPYSIAHKKTSNLQNSSIRNIMGRINNRVEMSICVQVIWELQRVVSEPPRAHGRYSFSTKSVYSIKKETKRDSDNFVRNNRRNIPYFARHCAHETLLMN
jgi:hypothetical protein